MLCSCFSIVLYLLTFFCRRTTCFSTKICVKVCPNKLKYVSKDCTICEETLHNKKVKTFEEGS